MHLRQAIDDYAGWLRTGRAVSPHTVRAYVGDLAQFAGRSGEILVTEVRHQFVLDFVDSQRLKGVSVRTIRRRLAAVRGLQTWLPAQSSAEPDPWGLRHVRLQLPRQLPRVASAADVKKLFSGLRQEIGEVGDPGLATIAHVHGATTLLAVTLMLTTGVRVGEVTGIRLSRVHLEDGAITVTGKGSRDRTVYVADQWVAGLLAAYLGVREAREMHHDLLLFGRRGDPLSPAALRMRLRAASSRAGLRVAITPHMLRHTAATQLIESGVDIRLIQKLLGHASISTTEIYTHVSDAAVQSAVRSARVLEGRFRTDN